MIKGMNSVSWNNSVFDREYNTAINSKGEKYILLVIVLVEWAVMIMDSVYELFNILAKGTKV